MLGRKPVSCAALEYMLERGVEVAGVVIPEPGEGELHERTLWETARSRGVPLIDEAELYQGLEGAPSLLSEQLGEIDLLICMFHQAKIREPVLGMGRLASINFHPAPLPEYRGWGVYNQAILDDIGYWGAAAHHMDDRFDAGDLIDQERFDVDMARETCYSLERRTQPALLRLFRRVLDTALRDGALPREKQGEGRTITKADFLRQRVVSPHDDPALIERKVRAFWYPPHEGALIEIAGRTYTLLDTGMSQAIAPLWWIALRASSEINCTPGFDDELKRQLDQDKL